MWFRSWVSSCSNTLSNYGFGVSNLLTFYDSIWSPCLSLFPVNDLCGYFHFCQWAPMCWSIQCFTSFFLFLLKLSHGFAHIDIYGVVDMIQNLPNIAPLSVVSTCMLLPIPEPQFWIYNYTHIYSSEIWLPMPM